MISLTGVCVGNSRRIGVVEDVVAQRPDRVDHDGTNAADDDGPEEGGLLDSCPAAVAEWCRPEVRCGRHIAAETISESESKSVEEVMRTQLDV